MIRFAERSDIPAIMGFIDKHWKKDHILSKNYDLFCYEYSGNDKVNMVISVNDNGDIDGIEGFIPYGKDNKNIMLSMWKVLKSSDPFLGVEILNYLTAETKTVSVSCTGIHPKTIGIYEYLGYHTGKMTQWYRLNKKDSYKIAKVDNSLVPDKKTDRQYKLTLFSTFDELKEKFSFEKYCLSDPKPLKEDWYVKKRYFDHPVYEYKVYGIEDENGVIDTLAVFRVQECSGSSALRFVDVIGKTENVYMITEAIDELMQQLDAEYADIYEKGLSADRMIGAGWLNVAESGNIIPNYFSPFLQENIDINYFVQDEETVLFKADGDQDRPN